jgi:beta-lactam-binding protein with PASTA domain
MRSSRFSLPRIPYLLAACFLAAFIGDGAPVRAAEPMPDVVGRTERAAVHTLEARGLVVHVVTIAGHPPGIVASQDPAAGESVEGGDEVEIHVGVRITIDTTVPNAVGMTEEDAAEILGDTYFLEVEYVRGVAGREGRVIHQEPSAGTSLPLRGVLRLRIVRNAAEVPSLVGRQESEALALIEDAGLVASVSYVPASRGRLGTVVSQVPRAGAEVLPGGTIEIQVIGEGALDSRRQRVRVPDLTGLPAHEASELVFALGLTPHEHLAGGAGQPAWSVIAQEVAPGTIVLEGSNVGFTIARPPGTLASVRVPMLYGLEMSEAQALLRHMGLRAAPTLVPSGLAPGTVFGQRPAPGAMASAGREILLQVARQMPRGTAPPIVVVPDLSNMSAGRARMTLLQNGLDGHLHRALGPDGAINDVFRQEPAAGTSVPQGTSVNYYLPLRATVPDLSGMTRLQALDTLQGAGLQGLALRSGPARGGATRVAGQSTPPGRVVARGTLVRFRYVEAEPPSVSVPVPSVLNLATEEARRRLTDLGFHVVLRSLHVGAGRTVVVGQTPSGGSLLPRGSTITLSYRYAGGPFGTFVRVPRVIGLERDAARARLQRLGFRVHASRTGPAVLFGARTQVIAQSPLAGSPRVRGSLVRITWRYVGVGGGGVADVRVPRVVGQRVDRALDRLRREGFNVRMSGVGAHVRAQSPGGGSRARRGTTVTIRLRP